MNLNFWDIHFVQYGYGKEERKKIMDSQEGCVFIKEEWTELMNFYDDGLSNLWFYNDWVKAGKPRDK